MGILERKENYETTRNIFPLRSTNVLKFKQAVFVYSRAARSSFVLSINFVD